MEMRQASVDDKDELFMMCDALRAAAAPILAPNIDDIDPNRIAKMIAAASIFAGIQFGQLVAMGIARDRDRKRVIDGLGKNFKAGIDIGKKNTFRTAETLFGEAGNA